MLPGATSELLRRLVEDPMSSDAAELSAELRDVVPHEYFAYAQLSTITSRLARLVNVSFPSACLEQWGFSSASGECLVVREWLESRAPVALVGYDSLLFDAQLDSTGLGGLAFCFGSVCPDGLCAGASALRWITPFLYARLSRQFWIPHQTEDGRALTPREVQVVKWMYCGKTNEEIATLLGKSVHTVKNQVQSILLKLSATNRTQAVVRAVEAGWVSTGELF
jgi:DNA-binding CsgD family transcriptional regulator